MSAEYTYRRKLRANEKIPAIAAGVGAGLAIFYLARLLLQRTPVLPRATRLSRAEATRPRLPAVAPASD